MQSLTISSKSPIVFEILQLKKKRKSEHMYMSGMVIRTLFLNINAISRK